jgi:WD40 repeat protein
LWDTGSLKSGNNIFQGLTGHNGIINQVASSQDERFMATSGSDSLLIIWKIADPEISKIRTFKSPSPVKALVFCNNDSIIYSTENGSIILFKISGNENIELYRNLSDKPLSLAWNRNKNILFAGCINGTLLSMDINRYKTDEPKQFIVHASGIDMLVFNSDFSLLASSSWDKTIKIFNYSDFFELENNVTGVVHLNNLNYRVRSLIFSQDNKLIAGLSNKSVCLWETSEEVLSNKLKDLGMGATGGFTENEWIKIIGPEIPYEQTKPLIPEPIK